MPLNAAQMASAVTTLNLASSDGTAETFRRLERYKTSGRWLGANNVYAKNTIDQIAHDRTNDCINEKHLAEYISASSILHMADGWGYLGRAMQAHLIGDYAVARHLAYYAELRAAMSILACNGVGIFNSRHYVLTSPTSVVAVPPKSGTHEFAWVSLKWWAENPGSWDLVGKSIRPYGKPISEWLQLAPQYSVWGPAASDWISSLGLDIARVAGDQTSRNEASYRPTRIQTAKQYTSHSGVEFALDLWRALEPGATGFPTLDIHVLRLTVERAFESVEGRTPKQSPKKYAAMIDDVTSEIADTTTKELVSDFLTRVTQPTDISVFAHASRNTTDSSPHHHFEMMSRSSLLLSLATSSCRLLVEKAGSSLANHEFWWKSMGTDRGIWETAPPSADLKDFWLDIQMELEDVEEWMDANTSDHTRSMFLNDNPNSVSKLSLFELVALWGMPA